jgi:hypothetical protein
MSSLLWTLGSAALIVGVLLLVRTLFFAGPRRGSEGDGQPPASQTWTTMGTGGAVVRLAPEDVKQIRHDIRILHDMHSELRRVSDLLARILDETRATRPARVNPPEPRFGPARAAAEQPGRYTSPELVQGAPSQRTERDPGVRVRHDGAFDPNPLPPAPGVAQPREPSPGAVHVEASHDLVVPSDRHPPEAWMERDEVWLNPRFTLTDPALQRWSTFFDWERREPGARYHTERPAVVTVAGGVVRKGMARPL